VDERYLRRYCFRLAGPGCARLVVDVIKPGSRVIDCNSPKTGRVVLIIVDLHDCMRPVTEVVTRWHNRTISTIKADQLVDRGEFMEFMPDA